LNLGPAVDTKNPKEAELNCSEAQDRFLESLDGEPPLPSELQAHLQDCPECRRAVRQMRSGREGLLLYMEEAAPRRTYLTADRRARLMAAYGREHKIFRLTYRQFVAAAAAAAIIVSAAIVAPAVARLVRAPQPAPRFAQRASPQLPVVVTAHSQGGPLNVIRPITAVHSRRPSRPAPSSEQRLLRANSAGTTVPVNHAFYDPDESSHWW
jgi:hypothetical protein